MAETCRRVAGRVQELGFVRPSLVHLRRLVAAERDFREVERQRQEAIDEVVRDVAARIALGRIPDPHWVIERFERASGKSWT
jgi:hypothetical protein